MRSLDRCLKSVAWADAIVVHELSADLKAGSRPSVPTLPATGTDWVCSLWGEECVEPVLQEELLALRKQGLKSAAACYRIPIRSRVLGKWLKGSLWSPSPALRVGREGPFLPCEWSDSERTGTRAAGVLRGWLSDYSSSDLSVAVSRLNMVGEIWAASMAARGQAVGTSRAVVGSVKVFLRILTANGLVSGGIASLTLAVLAAYGRMLGATKLYEKSISCSTAVNEAGRPADRRDV
ncbi:MAG: hypothetical protein ACREQK_07555 [Candidatus Binatia bacterium]